MNEPGGHRDWIVPVDVDSPRVVHLHLPYLLELRSQLDRIEEKLDRLLADVGLADTGVQPIYKPQDESTFAP